MSQYIVGGEAYRQLDNGKKVRERWVWPVVKLEEIQNAYAEGSIDLEELERRIAAFLLMEEESIPYAEAYVLANGFNVQ